METLCAKDKRLLSLARIIAVLLCASIFSLRLKSIKQKVSRREAAGRTICSQCRKWHRRRRPRTKPRRSPLLLRSFLSFSRRSSRNVMAQKLRVSTALRGRKRCEAAGAADSVGGTLPEGAADDAEAVQHRWLLQPHASLLRLLALPSKKKSWTDVQP